MIRPPPAPAANMDRVTKHNLKNICVFWCVVVDGSVLAPCCSHCCTAAPAAAAAGWLAAAAICISHISLAGAVISAAASVLRAVQTSALQLLTPCYAVLPPRSGSKFGSKPVYREAARALGQELVKQRITLVYGGGTVGLMGEVGHTRRVRVSALRKAFEMTTQPTLLNPLPTPLR